MFVYVFAEKDIEKVLRDLRNLKPAFEAFGDYEIFAKSSDERVRVGKYRKTVVILAGDQLEFSTDPLDSYEVTLKGFDEKILENLPPLLSDITVARILVRDARLRAEYLTKEETRIIGEITKILEGAKTLSISKLEELAYSISTLKGSFFSAYMQFKDELEEVSSALIRARNLSEIGRCVQRRDRVAGEKPPRTSHVRIELRSYAERSQRRSRYRPFET